MKITNTLWGNIFKSDTSSEHASRLSVLKKIHLFSELSRFELGRISDIIHAVDEPIRATRCEPGSATGCISKHSRCLTHDLWSELSHQIELYLSSVTLADVGSGRVLGTARLFDTMPPELTVAAQ